MPLHDYPSESSPQSQAVKLPWGLRETGFTESNSLVWTYNLQRYVHIPNTFQVFPPRPIHIGTLRRETHNLILGSRLRIIIICGDNAEKLALPDNADLKKVKIFYMRLHMLHGLVLNNRRSNESLFVRLSPFQTFGLLKEDRSFTLRTCFVSWLLSQTTRSSQISLGLLGFWL